MRDGQGCLLPVLRCHGRSRLPQKHEEDDCTVPWSFSPSKTCRGEQSLQPKARRSFKSKRKRSHRAKQKTPAADLQQGGKALPQADPQQVFEDGEGSSSSSISPKENDFMPYEEDDTSLLPRVDDGTALRCLAFVSRSDHWKLSLLGKRYYQLVRSPTLFDARRRYGIIEQWVCMYTSGDGGWTAYDPKQRVWLNLPHATVDRNFDLSDRESLSAGTHLLWLGKEAFDFACYKYDLVTNGWEKGPAMVNPRCLFGSASCGEFAFVAGGFRVGEFPPPVLNSAERYDSKSGRWDPLPNMATGRHKCSGFFMDGKFYVIGGKDGNHQPLTSGEEFDPSCRTWRTIENMYVPPAVPPAFEPSPPLVAVANNELYSIESSTNVLKVYVKSSNTWKVLGPVPVRADFCNGWGLAFKALGDELFVIGGHKASDWEQEGIAVFSWRPRADATEPEWQLVNSRVRGIGNFLYNCAVMSC